MRKLVDSPPPGVGDADGESVAHQLIEVADAMLFVVSGARYGDAEAIDLLHRADGASVEELSLALGWQSHSVRGAISGALKKKLGLTVMSEQNAIRGRVYRIAAEG